MLFWATHQQQSLPKHSSTSGTDVAPRLRVYPVCKLSYRNTETTARQHRNSGKVPEGRGGCRYAASYGAIAGGLMLTAVGPTLNIRPVPADQPSGVTTCIVGAAIQEHVAAYPLDLISSVAFCQDIGA